MSTDPNQVKLTPQQQKFLADLADRAGKPWSEVFIEALGQYHMPNTQHEEREPPKARFGSGKGLFTLSDDFDAPLSDFQDNSE